MKYATFKVTGFHDLDRQLAAIERGPTDAEKRSALMKGGAVIAEEERRLVPYRRGNLRNSIVVTALAVGLPDDANVVYIAPRIGRGGPSGWYGGKVEFGTFRNPAEPFARPAVVNVGEQAAQVVIMDLTRAVTGRVT